MILFQRLIQVLRQVSISRYRKVERNLREEEDKDGFLKFRGRFSFEFVRAFPYGGSGRDGETREGKKMQFQVARLGTLNLMSNKQTKTKTKSK